MPTCACCPVGEKSIHIHIHWILRNFNYLFSVCWMRRSNGTFAHIAVHPDSPKCFRGVQCSWKICKDGRHPEIDLRRIYSRSRRWKTCVLSAHGRKITLHSSLRPRLRALRPPRAPVHTAVLFCLRGHRLKVHEDFILQSRGQGLFGS